MKKLILVLVAVVIISNAIWSYLYFNKEVETNLNTGVQVYTLMGTGGYMGCFRLQNNNFI